MNSLNKKAWLKKKGWLKKIWIYLSIAFVAMIILYPIFLMIRISLMNPQMFYKPHKDLLFGKYAFTTLEHWKNVYNSGLLC